MTMSMFNRLLTALAILFAVLAATKARAETLGPTLREQVTIASDYVRIGDLVDNAGPFATIPVFRAPDLGMVGTVQASRILAAVEAQGLRNVDTRAIAEVTVIRASRSLKPAEVEAAITAAIARQLGIEDAGRVQLSFDRDLRTMYLEPAATGDVELAHLSLDPRTGRFDIAFDLAGSNIARRGALRFTGGYAEMVDTVVPLRPLARGETLRPQDVAIERRPKPQLGGDAVVALKAVVGMATRRPLPVGQPIRLADLMKPEWVEKNAPVTLIYETGTLSVSIKAKALESGTEGDLVAAQNLQTKRTVHGIVQAPGRILISSGGLPIPVAAAPR